MKSPLREREKIIKEGFANLQKNIEAVGGTLYLTNERLIFEAHWLNIQGGVTEVELCDIESSANCWTMLLDLIPVLPNACVVRTKYDEEYRFTVFRRNSWTRAIRLQSTEAGGRVSGKSATTSRVYAAMIFSLVLVALGGLQIHGAYSAYRSEVERRQRHADNTIIGFSTDGGAFGQAIDSSGYVKSETPRKWRDARLRVGGYTVVVGALGLLISLICLAVKRWQTGGA